jgi:shikimate kinase
MRIDMQSRLYCLTGIKHSGKSTLGSLLAAEIGCLFVDLDEQIENLFSAGEREKRPVREIYRRYGRRVFQDYEYRAAESIASAWETNPGTSLVAAAGGGIIDNPDACKALKPPALIIYLEEEAELLYERIIRNGIPPFLSGEDPRRDFLALYERRSSAYRDYADLTLALEGRTIEAVLGLLKRSLEKLG